MEWLQSFLKLIEVKPRFFFAIFMAGFIVLVLPDQWAATSGLDQLRMQYRPWIGGAAVGAFALWITGLWPLWQQGRITKRRHAANLKALETLSVKERMLFLACLESRQRTIWLEAGDSIALALTSKGLIGHAGGMGDPLRWPFTIPEYVWERLLAIEANWVEKIQEPTEEETRAFHFYKEKLSAKRPWGFTDR